MTTKIFYGVLLVVTLIALGSTTTAQAFELSDDFDEPCMGGQGILGAICNTVNDVHDFIHEQETRTDSLNSTQISQQSEIDGLEANVIIVQTNAANNTNRLNSILFNSTNPTFSAVEIELEKLRVVDSIILDDLNVLVGDLTQRIQTLEVNAITFHESNNEIKRIVVGFIAPSGLSTFSAICDFGSERVLNGTRSASLSNGTHAIATDPSFNMNTVPFSVEFEIVQRGISMQVNNSAGLPNYQGTAEVVCIDILD